MKQNEQANLESNAIQILSELYSDEEEENRENLDDYNNIKSPVISGWESPYKVAFKYATTPSQRVRQLSESPQKGKSTLSHLSENLQRYHTQAFSLKKTLFELEQDNFKGKLPQPIQQQEKQSKTFSSFSVLENGPRLSDATMPIQEIPVKTEGELDNLLISNDQGNTKEATQQKEISEAYQSQQPQKPSVVKRKLSFRKYTEQYDCKQQQQNDQSSIASMTSRKNSRSIMSASKQQEHRQQANVAVSNIDLYCVEEAVHANKDFKSTFRVVWKKQDRVNASYSRNSSQRKEDQPINFASSNPQSRASFLQRTDASYHTLTEFIYEDSHVAQNLITEMSEGRQPKGFQRYAPPVQIKNIYQKPLQTETTNNEMKENNIALMYDNKKIQTIFNNTNRSNSNSNINNNNNNNMTNESENSTQESIRKSSNSIYSKNNTQTQSKQELLENHSHFQIPIQRANSEKEDKERYHTLNNEEVVTVISEVIVPIHHRLNTDKQSRSKKQNTVRPMSQHVSSKQSQNEQNNSYSYQNYQNNSQVKTTLNTDQSQQNIYQNQNQNPYTFENNPSYEIGHKSFKQYNIPVTLRTHSFQKRNYTSSSRKNSNVSVEVRHSQNKSINDTLLFNIYKPNQIPAIQQRLNAFIQSQEESFKSQYLQNQNLDCSENNQSKNIFYSPLKNKNYCKYKPQIKVE